MKQIISTIIAGLVSVALFTGCKKDDSTNPQPYTSINTNPGAVTGIAVPNRAQVNYNITVIPPAETQFMQWNSGNMMTANIFFDGNVQFGNEMSKEHYSQSIDKTVTLLPGSTNGNATLLGNLTMLYGSYYAPVFGIVIAGINPPTSANSTNPPAHALMLSGIYTKNGANVGVQVIIDEPQTIMVNGENPTSMPGNQTNYSALLIFNLGMLTQGLNANSLSNASMTNNEIVISASINQNLYQIVVNNLQNSLQVKFSGSAVLLPSNGTPISAPPATK